LVKSEALETTWPRRGIGRPGPSRGGGGPLPSARRPEQPAPIIERPRLKHLNLKPSQERGIEINTRRLSLRPLVVQLKLEPGPTPEPRALSLRALRPDLEQIRVTASIIEQQVTTRQRVIERSVIPLHEQARWTQAQRR
jgi:hypothetical protein